MDSLPSRYAFRSTEKAALQEIGPRFTLKLRSLRTGLPAVKEFGEPSTRLEFDEFDDTAMEGGKSEDKGSDQPAAKGVCGGEKDEGGVEDGEPTSEPGEKTKPPTVDEYQWQWKVGYLGSLPAWQHADRMLQPQLETTRRTFFL